MSASATVLLSLCSRATALRFSTTHGDGMVLVAAPQQATVWGFYDAGDSAVQVCVDKTKCVDADLSTDGTFQAVLPAYPAKFDGHRISAKGSSGGTATLQQVLFGSVWVCSGQSNMDMAVPMVFNSSDEVNDADNYPYIRLLTIAKDEQNRDPMVEAANVTQSWVPASRATVGGEHWQPWTKDDFKNWENHIAHVPGGEGFSAACYFFGRELFGRVKSPVGLIWASHGGTPVEAWTPAAAREACGVTKATTGQRFNTQIVPLLRNVISGAIWYQGENNGKSLPLFEHYDCIFPAMIRAWRSSWSNATGGVAPKSWPFGFVQLSVHGGSLGEYGADLNAPGYAPVRWRQVAGLTEPDTFMATAVDIGQRASPAGGPHVQNKQEVAHRLFLAYSGQLGARDIFAPGPQAKEATLGAAGVAVSFQNLSPAGFGRLPTQIGFEVSGGDGKWLNVSGVELSKDSRSVVLALPSELPHPRLVRYLWATNPCLPEPGFECPLHDADQHALPALPFVMNISTKAHPSSWVV